ncbi:hypothetical protein HanRHA438_Chr03g0131351 [Helianthus annuus]|nr:hypothetical protein HanRHA438_Chr03g0131351 [Helianthus annuus]
MIPPGNLLTGFGFYEPYCLVAFANACRISRIQSPKFSMYLW